MESYTTISVKPKIKKRLKKLKGSSQTYGEYIDEIMPEDVELDEVEIEEEED